jgi:hypothetical protein
VSGHGVGAVATPGPWHARRGVSQMCDPDATTVANVGPVDADGARWWIFSPAEDHGDSEATARLVASAPAMQQALAKLVECIHETRGPAAHEALTEARAALALSRGGPQL